MDISNLFSKNLNELLFMADSVRQENVGDIIHIRALLEISNICYRNCAYCGLRSANKNLTRYAMEIENIEKTGKLAFDNGYKTIVLQSGESNIYDIEKFAEMVNRLSSIGLIVTLSLGELSYNELKLLKAAGAKRYLLKFETADEKIYSSLHKGHYLSERLECLSYIKELGYEVGSGFLVGLPCESDEIVIQNLALLEKLQCDMAGIGVFIPHKETPLKDIKCGSVEVTKKCIAITRLLLPKCNIPITTSLSEFGDKYSMFFGGANVIMQNITPQNLVENYQIYPKNSVKIDMVKDRENLVQDLIRLNRIPL